MTGRQVSYATASKYIDLDPAHNTPEFRYLSRTDDLRFFPGFIAVTSGKVKHMFRWNTVLYMPFVFSHYTVNLVAR